MVAKSTDLFTPRIPRRQLARPVGPNMLGAAFQLADKICELPNIVSIEHGAAGNSGVCLTYRPPSALSLRKTGELQFCKIYADRILVDGLAEKLANELADKGWAVNDGRWTMLHMPRDSYEAEICWQIIWHRYRDLSSSRQANTRKISAAALPQFSRSNHR